MEYTYLEMKALSTLYSKVDGKVSKVDDVNDVNDV